jgi:hypothetical protein
MEMLEYKHEDVRDLVNLCRSKGRSAGSRTKVESPTVGRDEDRKANDDRLSTPITKRRNVILQGEVLRTLPTSKMDAGTSLLTPLSESNTRIGTPNTDNSMNNNEITNVSIKLNDAVMTVEECVRS